MCICNFPGIRRSSGVSKDVRQQAWDEANFMSKIIIGAESRVHCYDPQTTAVLTVEEPAVSKTKEGALGQESKQVRGLCTP